MWSIWTSWPGFRGLAPYFQRCAQPLNLRRRLGSRRPSQALARGTQPLAMARERMRPTVETLRRRPLRSSRRWMGALPMNGCLRRRSMTAFTSLVLYDRRRTWRGRVDFGARPRWPLAASAAFHRNMVRRLTPISFKAACSAQPAFAGRRRRRSFRRRRRTRPVMAATVPNLSEPAQRLVFAGGTLDAKRCLALGEGRFAHHAVDERPAASGFALEPAGTRTRHGDAKGIALCLVGRTANSLLRAAAKVSISQHTPNACRRSPRR